MTRPLVDTQAAAAALEMSFFTLMAAVSHGAPVHRVGDTWLWDLDELREWVATRDAAKWDGVIP